MAIAAWMTLAVLYLIPLLDSALGYPLGKKPAPPSPNPAISFEDATLDRPPAEAFDSSGYRDINRSEAYSFTVSRRPTPCARMWRADLRHMRWGDRVQLSGPVPGKGGICDWYQMRIVSPSGAVKPGGFGRPGPRKVGQLPGEPVLKNPDELKVMNVRPSGPPSFTVKRMSDEEVRRMVPREYLLREKR